MVAKWHNCYVSRSARERRLPARIQFHLSYCIRFTNELWVFVCVEKPSIGVSVDVPCVYGEIRGSERKMSATEMGGGSYIYRKHSNLVYGSTVNGIQEWPECVRRSAKWQNDGGGDIDQFNCIHFHELLVSVRFLIFDTLHVVRIPNKNLQSF